MVVFLSSSSSSASGFLTVQVCPFSSSFIVYVPSFLLPYLPLTNLSFLNILVRLENTILLLETIFLLSSFSWKTSLSKPLSRVLPSLTHRLARTLPLSSSIDNLSVDFPQQILAATWSHERQFWWLWLLSDGWYWHTKSRRLPSCRTTECRYSESRRIQGDFGILIVGIYSHLLEQIGALEIERIFLAHPAIRQCACIGVPDDVYGQRVGLVIEAAKDMENLLSVEALRAFAAEDLPAYKLPTIVKVSEMWYDAIF